MLLKPLSAFVTTVRTASFAKAAEELGISTSSISRLVQQLEHELGFALLERTTRKLYLTDAGTIFYQKAQEILAIYSSSKENLSSLNNQYAGNIKIGAPSSMTYLYLSNCIDEFLAQYPALTITMLNGDHLLDLLENDFDFVLHCRPLPDSALHYKKLASWTRILCASPKYLANNPAGIPQNPNDLAAHNCLINYHNKERAWALIHKDKIKNFAIKSNIITDSNLNIKNLALKHMGIAYLPSFIVYREIVRGELVKLLPDSYLPNQEIYAVYSANKYRKQKVKALLDFLTQKIRQQGD